MDKFLFFCILLTVSFSCQEPVANSDTAQPLLGQITIDISGSDDAKPIFKEGLLLMHSFEYKDAEEKFQLAQDADSTCAMAYWGEAMCKNHPLWREQEQDEAKEILAKLGATAEQQRSKFKTEFEKDMFDAVHILYGEGSKNQRDKAYSSHLEMLHKKYPDHHEVGSFYALSLLGAQEDGRDKESYAKGARIAKSIIDENPNHPGALHYLIHSYDDPDNAPKAKDAADRYAQVAPAASHALHMPSHIYVALGKWDEVISSNIASWKASVKRKEAKDLTNNALGYHSYKWLMYGYLQNENYVKAKEIIEHTQALCYEHPTSKSEGHLAMMKSAYFSETGQWDDDLAIDTIDYSPRPIQLYGLHCFIKGMRASHQQDHATVTEVIKQLKTKIKETSKEVYFGNPSMCSGSYSRGRPTQTHVDRAKVIVLQLEAAVAMHAKDMAQVEEKLLEATKLEETTMYMYGPPEVPKPSWEMYADWLLEQGRKTEALEYYEETLIRYPNRLLATKGVSNSSDNS